MGIVKTRENFRTVLIICAMTALTSGCAQSGTAISAPVGSGARLDTTRANDLTLAQAIDLALKRNFDSRIEYERLISAKHASKAAWLNLLPHLSLSGVLAAFTPSATNLFWSRGRSCALSPTQKLVQGA